MLTAAKSKGIVKKSENKNLFNIVVFQLIEIVNRASQSRTAVFSSYYLVNAVAYSCNHCYYLIRPFCTTKSTKIAINNRFYSKFGIGITSQINKQKRLWKFRFVESSKKFCLSTPAVLFYVLRLHVIGLILENPQAG